LRKHHDEPGGAAGVTSKRKIAAGRLFELENLLEGFDVPYKPKERLNRHRARARHLWDDYGHPSGCRETQAESWGQREAAKVRREMNRLNEGAARHKRLDKAGRLDRIRQGIEDSLPPAASGGAARLSGAARKAATSHFRAAVAAKTRAGARQGLARPAAAIHAEVASSMSQLPRVRRPDAEGSAPWPGLDFDDVVAPEAFAAVDDATWRAEFDQWEQSDRQGPMPFNPEQRDVLRETFRCADFRARARARGCSESDIRKKIEDAGYSSAIFLTGPGGSGKSAVVYALIESLVEAQAGRVVVSAFTGAAAAQFSAPTLSTLFNLGRAGGAARFPAPYCERRAGALRARFIAECGVDPDDLALLVIDEVSFNTAAFLGHVDHALRALKGEKDVPCGGVIVLLAGDFHQLKPPGQGDSIAHALVKGASRVDSTASAAGLRLFASARKFDLTRNMRAMDDPPFVEAQNGMRDTSRRSPITDALLQKIKSLSATDLEDPPWRFPPIGVKSNFERHTINLAQVRSFAKYFDLPLFKWRVRVPCPVAFECLSPADREDVFKDEPLLYEYFVEGAPATLRENMCSRKGLVNNAPCLLDSLDFGHAPPREVVAAYERGGFCEVEIEPPVNVLVRVGSAPEPARGKDRGHFWHGVRLPDLSSKLPTNVVARADDPDAQIIPLQLDGSSHRRDVKLWSRISAQHALPEEISTWPFAYELAFAVTDYKLQSRSLPRIALNLPKCETQSMTRMKFESFYVLVSRGLKFESLRWNQCDIGERDKLLTLRHDKELVAFERAWDENRRYDHARARAVLAEQTPGQKQTSRKKKAAPPRRARNPPPAPEAPPTAPPSGRPARQNAHAQPATAPPDPSRPPTRSTSKRGRA